jgi:hypothetical protein
MATLEEFGQMLVDDFNDRTYRENAPSYIAEDCVSVDLPTGQEAYGVEGSIQSLDRWTIAFPNATAEVVSHEVSGNTVTTTIVGRGTFDGEMMAPDGSMIPGNGMPLALNYTQEVEVVDGMVVRITANYDMQDMLSQLGLG